MEQLGFASMIIGICGLCFATLGIPAFASFFGSRARVQSRKGVAPAKSGITSLSIWVAAHNEEKVIRETLESLLASVDYAKKVKGLNYHFELGVALDHCADATLDEVEKFEKLHDLHINVLENPGEGAKWWNLKNIISHVSSDWVIFVDAGSLWDIKLASRAIEEMREGVVAIAPSYSANKSGLSERLNWKLESYLKKFENRVGGPVSVHGASVFYRTDSLKKVIAELGDDHWLNDDVVVPLSLRLRDRNAETVYLADHSTGWVTDLGVRTELELEYRRRRRMAYGNIQWIQKVLFTKKALHSPMAFFLALRRVFRLFWAYWVLAIAFGLSVLSTDVAIIIFFLGLIGVNRSQFLRRVGMAFWSGLQVPNLWREFSFSKRGVTWS